MSTEEAPPPPPPEEDELAPPPPPEDDDDDDGIEDDNKDDGEFATMISPPPPPEKFAMSAEEAGSTGFRNLQNKIFEVAIQDLLICGPGAPSPVMQMIKLKTKPVPPKVIFAVTILFHDWETFGQEAADLLDLDWTDFSTPQVQTLLKDCGLLQKEEYSVLEVKDAIVRKLNALLERTSGGAEIMVPSMLEFVTQKIAESLSLSTNMTFRMSVDLGQTNAKELEEKSKS